MKNNHSKSRELFNLSETKQEPNLRNHPPHTLDSFLSIKLPRSNRTPSETSKALTPTYLPFPFKAVFASQLRHLTFMQNNAHPFPADATSRNRRSAITNAECPICSPLPLRRCDIAISHIGSRKHQNVQPNDPPLSPPTRYRIGTSSPTVHPVPHHVALYQGPTDDVIHRTVDAVLTSAARKAEKASRRKKSRTSELQIKKQRQFPIFRRIFRESSGCRAHCAPKSLKIAQTCQRIRFEDNSRSFTKFKVYQIKSAGIKHVKEYQSTADTINVVAKCIRKYLEQWPKAREN